MTRKNEQLSLFAAFAAAGVEYAVVGGVAVNAYGHVRNTRDLDIFIRPTLENAQAAFAALQQLGVPLEGLGPDDLLIDYEHFQIQSTNGRVDILPSIGDMSFDTVWRNRVKVTVEGVPISFISKADLIENKKQVGRLIDLADVERLEQIADQDVQTLPDV